MSASGNESKWGDDVGVTLGHVFGGRFRVTGLLGAGGMGAVFEAKHEAIGKVVAIKVLHPSLAQAPKFVARFLQEAKTATEVHHRNIVQILDFGVEDGRPYMVMEYLRGESLAALISRERRIPPGRLVRLLDPILRALAFAHERGVVHRDLKPDNVFLAREDDDAEPVPKLLDFGIAKRESAGDVRLTDTHASMGTPAYMAPEQAMGARDVTAAADQYAVGVILYEALTGRLPHEGETYNAMLIAKVTGVPTPLAQLRPDLPPAFSAAVTRALAQNPDERFRDVAALREALMPFRDGAAEPMGAAPDAVQPPMDPTQADGTPAIRQALAATMVAAALPGGDAASANPVLPTNAEGTIVRAEEPATDSTATPGPVTTARPSAGVPEKTRRRVFWAAGLVLAGIAVEFAVTRRAPAVRTPDAPANVTRGGVSEVARREEPVTFRVRVEPPSAEIVLDESVVGHGTAEVIRPRDGHRHQLVLRAPGYIEVSEVLVADADVRVDRALVSSNPIVPAVPAIPGVSGAVRRTVAPATTTTGAAPGPRRPHIDRSNPF